MDPITLLILGGGGYLGYKKVWPWLKDRIQHDRATPNLIAKGSDLLHLDAGLSNLQREEIRNLLVNVRDAALLRSAASLYQAQNFPLAASVLSHRAQALGG